MCHLLSLISCSSFPDLLYLFQQNANLYGEQCGEEGEEDEERKHDAARTDVAHGHPRRHHVLYGPRLTSEFGHEPSRFAGNIAQWQQHDGGAVEQAVAGDVLAENDEQHHGEEDDEQRAESDHHAESIEAQRNVRHELRLVLDISVSEVWHVLLQSVAQYLAAGRLLFGQFARAGLCSQFAVFLQSQYGPLAAAYLFVHGYLAGVVLEHISARIISLMPGTYPLMSRVARNDRP